MSCRRRWDSAIFLLACLVIWGVPLKMAFPEIFMDRGWFRGIDNFIDSVFMLDIILNFLTSYPNQMGIEIKDHKSIAIHYMTGWFVPDLVSCVPFQHAIEDGETAMIHQ